jgi:hypothetical protein
VVLCVGWIYWCVDLGVDVGVGDIVDDVSLFEWEL